MLTGILLALFGFTLFSSGVVLMKAGSSWIGWKGAKDGGFRKDRAVWLAGLLLYNLALIPNTLASGSIPPHIVSAISGWGIVVIVILSAILLKERVLLSDFIHAGLILASIFLVSILDRTLVIERIDMTAFYVMCALPFLLLVPAFFRRVGAKTRTVLFSILAGCIGGFALVIMNVVVNERGSDVLGYLETPYPYLFLTTGIAAFVVLQLAMKTGAMMLVGPLQNSFVILYPLVCSFLVFGMTPSFVQVAAMAVTVFASFRISMKH